MKRTTKFGIIGLGVGVLGLSAIATSVVLTSCGTGSSFSSAFKKKNYVSFDAKVTSSNARNGQTVVDLDPSTNQNAIKTYINLLENLTKNDFQREFKNGLLQFYDATEFEQETSSQEVEAEIMDVTVTNAKYITPAEAKNVFGKFEISADVKYKVETEIETNDGSDDRRRDKEFTEIQTQSKTFTLIPKFAGKNEITDITNQLNAWQAKASGKLNDVLDELKEIYFGDKDKFELDDIFDNDDDRSLRIARAEQADGSTGSTDGTGGVTETPVQTTFEPKFTFDPVSGSVKIDVILTGQNLNTSGTYTLEDKEAGTKVNLNIVNATTTRIVLSATEPYDNAQHLINKMIVIKESETQVPSSSESIKSGAMLMPVPTFMIKNNVDRNQLSSINETNYETFLNILNWQNIKNFVSVSKVETNVGTGKIDLTFNIKEEYKQNISFPIPSIENGPIYSVKVSSTNSAPIPNGNNVVPGSNNWEDNGGVLNFVNNFINNVNPFAKMAGWEISIKEGEYIPNSSTNPSTREYANPYESIWVPSVSISSIFYPTIGNASNPSTNLGSVPPGISNDGVELNINLQTLSTMTMKEWLDTVFGPNAITQKKQTFNSKQEIAGILENLKAFGISFGENQKATSIVFDANDLAEDNEIELSINVGNIEYELDIQGSWFKTAKA